MVKKIKGDLEKSFVGNKKTFPSLDKIKSILPKIPKNSAKINTILKRSNTRGV